MKQIVFCVGANTGIALVDGAKKNSNCQYFAFEPVPQLFEKLISITENFANIVLIKKAVSDFNGKAIFNVADESDNHTVSSLLDFTDNVHDNWPGVEKHINFVDKIEVNVIRLEDFIDNFGITHIDYLHCDAQGSDLNVLKGLGSKISIVKEGCVEAAIKYNVLYKNQCMIDQVSKFLENNNFIVTKIVNNDAFGNEANVYFINKNYLNVNQH